MATVDSSMHSEEPWDQRGLVETAASAIRNWKEVGELPSLAVNRKSTKSPVVPTPDTEEPSSSPTEEEETMPSGRRREEFWSQMEIAADELAKDHGPDDEMAARKAARRRRRLEAESQLTDEEEEYEEEEEEEVYETAFCGSTILGELCGMGGATQVKQPATVRVRSLSPRSATSDQQQEQTAIEVEFVDRPKQDLPSDSETSGTRRISDRARRAKETMRNRRVYRKAQSSSPQESQTSEVSTPEQTPEKPTTREIIDQEEMEVQLEPEQAVPPSPATQKKNARLAAIAKKARDNFQIRKGKPANISSEPVQAKSTRQPRSSPKKSVDEDYATFTATEKRMFIKLINGGMPATEATQKVIEDRGLDMKKPAVSPSRRPFWKKDPPLERTADPPGESSKERSTLPTTEDTDQPNSTTDNRRQHSLEKEDENTTPVETVEAHETTDDGTKEVEQHDDSNGRIVSPLMTKLSSASPRNITSNGSSELRTTSSDDLFPFKKTGLTYFDATRREKDEDPLYQQGTDKNPSSGRSTPRFFGAKSPGFSELKESPEHRSNSAPPSRSPESASQNQSSELYDSKEVSGVVDESIRAASLTGPLVPLKTRRYLKVADNDKAAAAYKEVSDTTRSKGATHLRAPSGDDDEQRPEEQSPVASEAQNESLDMDSYLDSAKEGFVQAKTVNDAASVFTMGTSVTGMTSYSTSTRTRRPGAAKSRLAKHKQQETEAAKQLGWHQSIQAAAQSNNRRWDPEKGWVDYEEPEAYPDAVPAPQEKIKVDLNKAKLKHDNTSSKSSRPESKGESVNIGFPDEWANERKAMIQANTPTGIASRDQSRGWVESMKIASAQQAKDGNSWDPDRGWNAGTKDKSSDSVDFGRRSRPLQLDTRTLQPVRVVAQSVRNDDRLVNEDTDQHEITDDDDNVALLGSQSKKGPMSPMVEVIKQKVDEHDMRNFSPSRGFTDNRSSGPVDVDEVTRSMEAEESGGNLKTDTILGNQNAQAALRQSLDRSGGRSRASPKTIPRLNRSLRDTSPIAFRSKKDSRESSPEDEILVQTTETEGNSSHQDTEKLDRQPSGSSSIKDRMKTWETRIEAANSADADDSGPKQVLTPGGSYSSAGWQTFLGKKVRETRESVEGRSTTGNAKLAKSNSNPNVSALNISDISPIDAKSEDEAEYGSSAYGPSEGELRSSSLMKRLTECANPVMASTYQSRSMVPPALCGRRSKDDDSSVVESASSTDDRKQPSKPQSNTTKPKGSSAYSVATSSVVSEDFGVKTAYLDAVAMKTAVSRSRRPTSRRRARSSASSVASSASTDHSDKWRQLLEKRRSNGKISSRLSSSDISRATEKYASDKVSEIMQSISSRSKTVARSREVHREHDKTPQPQRLHRYRRRAQEADAGTSSDEDLSIQAAEDLAAARVEAMMAALSSDQGAEGEI